MFTKKKSLILSTVIAVFFISTSFPSIAATEAGLPEKSSLNAGSRWEQMVRKQQEEAAASAAAQKKTILEKEFESMKKVNTTKEPPAHKPLTYEERLENRDAELRKEEQAKEDAAMKAAAKSPVMRKLMVEQGIMPKEAAKAPVKIPEAVVKAAPPVPANLKEEALETVTKPEGIKTTDAKPVAPEKVLPSQPEKPTAPRKEPSPTLRRLMEKYDKADAVKVPEQPPANLKEEAQ